MHSVLVVCAAFDYTCALVCLYISDLERKHPDCAWLLLPCLKSKIAGLPIAGRHDCSFTVQATRAKVLYTVDPNICLEW